MPVCSTAGFTLRALSSLTMSLDNLHSSSSSNDHNRPTTEATDIELGVRLLGSLVAESEVIPADDSELLELLARLDSADTVASGVEAKLDGILGTLDDLLTSLELKDDSDKQQEAAIPRSEPQSGHPRSEQS
ncbi:hypothetical protein J3R82DRAFT_291 [Butyriboletus roseoflavus]|nr:hypothetical protein J3R82DRAFT_291 [Butyriboletus roseoflavus]